MSYEIPVLESCPYHGDTPPDGIASCHICWTRFSIPFNWAPKLNQLKHQISEYEFRVNRAKQYISLREQGFNTEKAAPKDLLVEFALPDDTRVVGREIDDLMGGTYPVKDDPQQTPISIYLGWRKA